MSRWFRHYAGMMRDDKLVSTAIKSKQSIERVVWIWGAILESAAEIDDHGRYDVDPAEIAYFLRADEADIIAVLDRLADAGRVAAGVVVKWGDRQFQSDRSAPRQAAYRERKRSGDGGSDDSKKSRDDGVTSPSRHGDAPETETELKTEKERKKETANAVYAFTGRIIRLKTDDFAAWKRAFGNIDLMAELQSRDDWLSSDAAPPELRKKWFHSTSKYLSNQNQTQRNNHPPTAQGVPSLRSLAPAI